MRTALPVLLAEELDVNFDTVRVETLPYDAASAGQFNTWASASVRGAWTSLRKAGATARAMLVEAAAQQWGIPVHRVRTANGVAINLDTNATLPYGALADAASRLPIPAEVQYKNPAEYRFIGKSVTRQRVREKINGAETFGIDVALPGMLVAMVVRSPTFHGKVKSFDDGAVRALGAGIVAVLEVKQMPGCDNRNGVAIVATSTWLAMQGQNLLKVQWEGEPPAYADNAALARGMREAIADSMPAATFDANGKSKAFVPSEGALLTAEYELPYLHQATMETPNCVASWQDGKYEVWGGFQAPSFFASALAKAFEVDRSAVFVHLLPMGGGFGRKEKVDNAAEAMQLAKALGKPVKLLFSRPDDVANSFYRPATVHRLAARAAKGGIDVWRHQAAVTSFPAKAIMSPQHLSGGLSNDLIYPVGDYQTAVYPVISPLPVGSWRAISYSQNVFVVESFIDELARQQKVDPLRFRLQLLRQGGDEDSPSSHRVRMAAVLARCGDAIGWGRAAKKGRHRGIACCVYTHTHAYTAHAFEVSVVKGSVKIHRVVCVTDCGIVVDPSGFRAQIEGSLVWGLSAVLTGEITFKDGAVTQQNFADYEVLRMHQLPPLELIVIDSNEPPAGAGEPAVPSVAPALCNAIAAATGRPVRKLPLAAVGFTLA
ncbi:xanthine dehydrogenase family protein molybdopterin-binding subunit [Pseudoduganella lutea]|uniref:Xanthine dehydrogenase family protein molybdopterin-binding subunit n=1 Tax=Pseudoduganella lutea TaxID=321985 RepID=A0A4P6L402_9BURK|nr:molybdopterin cofactor-binding domain-containing protein [Pseudoduganella lutea]QBE66396.1 xanthine dehydrogenase family protein molybdopterin-binding subunit [Pseudoduganella lutea]